MAVGVILWRQSQSLRDIFGEAGYVGGMIVFRGPLATHVGVFCDDYDNRFGVCVIGEGVSVLSA